MELKHFVSNVNTKLKKNIIARGDEVLQVPRFDSGSLSLNVELGGGVPEGRVITLAGLESDGKSATALLMLAGCLRKYPHKQALWIDAEGVWDDNWSRTLGIDVDRVYVVRPEYAEQGYQIAIEGLQSDDLCYLGIDSVTAMVPKAEAEGDMEDVQVALQARLHKKFLRKATSFLLNLEREDMPTIVIINQMTTNIGGYGNPDMEGGGKGLRYVPSVKIVLKKGEMFDGKKFYKYVGANDEGVEVKAQAIKFYVDKNKTAPPKRRGHFWFYFDHLDSIRTKGSVDRLEEIIRYAQKYDIVTQRSSAFDIPDPKTGEVLTFKGSAKLAAYIRENKDVQAWIEKEVLEKVNHLHKDKEVSKDEEEEVSQGGIEDPTDFLGGEWDTFTTDDETARIEGGKGTWSKAPA